MYSLVVYVTHGRTVIIDERQRKVGTDGGADSQRNASYLVPVCLVCLLRKSRYPEDLGGLQKTAKRTLMHVHLPVIDELHQGVQVAERHVLKYYHRVFARCALQKGKQRGKEET